MKYRRIHILGASGAGTTTLAKALCERTGADHFDSDDYFWKVKYTQPWPRELRLQMLRTGLEASDSWILSGALIDWGNPLIPLFEAVIFLSVPNEIRMERLKAREKQRYGDAILPGGSAHETFTEFITWANLYENGGMDVRSRIQQEAWITDLSCPVLCIDGNRHLGQIVDEVLDFIGVS
ncbi:MAG: AAA family ATPase [Candidatus Latescibacteria bacterium]|nr:AAA family ATPase [Candidatus Latescibacterota bacterium]